MLAVESWRHVDRRVLIFFWRCSQGDKSGMARGTASWDWQWCWRPSISFNPSATFILPSSFQRKIITYLEAAFFAIVTPNQQTLRVSKMLSLYFIEITVRF